MAERVQVKKARRDAARSEAEVETLPAPSEGAEELRDSLDALLDEIDEVLEANACEVVTMFVQHGGE